MLRVARKALQAGAKPVAAVQMSAWVLLLLHSVAQAQTTPPAKADEEVKPSILEGYVPSEEAKRRAMGPLRIIRQTSDQRRQAAPTPAPEVKPTPVSAAPAPAPARPRNEPAVVERAAAVVEVPEPAPVIVAPVPAPAPVQVAKPAPVPTPPPAPRNMDLIPISQDPPVLSRALLRENPRGIVKVAFDINPDGRTGDVQVISSTNRRLNTVATEAVAKWRFKPIDESVRVDIDLNFTPD